MRKDRRSRPETRAALIPPGRKPPTAVGTATLPEPSRPDRTAYPRRRTQVQRIATVLLGSSCVLVAGLLLASGAAGMWPVELVFATAGAGIGVRSVQLNRAERRRMRMHRAG